MHLIVGLGNAGRKYARTRHNVGFDVLELLSDELRISMTKLKCKAVVGEGSIGSERVALAQPQTFMNLSGESVVALVNWYKVEPEKLMVVYDDVDLPQGKLRLRPKGSAGTHNGMRNIIQLLGRDDFPRVRVGIGKQPEGWALADYVLTGYASESERQAAFDAYRLAGKIIQTWVQSGYEAAARLLMAAPPTP